MGSLQNPVPGYLVLPGSCLLPYRCVSDKSDLLGILKVIVFPGPYTSAELLTPAPKISSHSPTIEVLLHVLTFSGLSSLHSQVWRVCSPGGFL